MRHLVAGIVGLAAVASLGCGDGGTEPVGEGEYVRFITDAQGRAMIFHGANVMSSSKGDPLRMPTLTAEDALQFSRDWGFSLVRFLIFWDAIEPQPGAIDPAYLDRVEERLDWLHAAGQLVVLDMHQDVYAQRFCCDGAPEWAIRDDGEPFELQNQWFMNYFQPAVQRAFDNFWDYAGPHSDLQDHYAGAWAAVAARFKDHPAVIGYDLINEPHPGSMVDLQEILMGLENPEGPSPEFDRTRLQPFYQRMIDAIREVDDDGWLFYEPRYGAPGNGLKSYLGRLEDPRPGHPRIAYFPHLYSIRVESQGEYDPDADRSIENWERERAADVEVQDAPMLLGEWGLDWSVPGGTDFMAEVLAMADRRLAGWTYWSYDPGSWSWRNADGSESAAADLLVRPYPRRVAGVPTRLRYDPATRVMELEFRERAGVQGPTEIYVAAGRHYPQGFVLEIDGAEQDGAWSFDATLEIAAVTTPRTGGTHRIVLRPSAGQETGAVLARGRARAHALHCNPAP